MKDLLCKNDDIVVVRGCAGCGKTSLVEMFTMKWAEGELETKIPIDFIFAFSCREINTYLDEIDTVEDLLKKKYPEIFNSINVDNLRPVADRILIILDGVDELKSIYEMADGKNTQSNKYLQTLYNLIDSNGTFLKGHKSIIAGRPKAAEFIKSKLISKNKSKTVEVCGFSPENIDKYIDNFFGGSNRTKAQKVREAIAESDNLKVMASVPVFLWIIYNIFSDDLIAKPLTSNTELYFYTLLVFMRNHLRSSSTGNHHAYRDLYTIVNDDSILNAISLLMSRSTKTYMQNKVIFEESDIPEYLNLEETGFITKYSRGINQKPAYQFTHLVIQEFLCSLNLCITKSTSSYASNRELSSCLPTILGIQRMLNSGENALFQELYGRLEQEHLTKLTFSGKMSRKIKSIKFNRLINRTKLPNLMLRDNVLVIDTRKSECREYMDLLFEAKFNVDCPRVDDAEIHSVFTPTDMRNACFLLEKLGINKINHSSLTEVDDRGKVTLTEPFINKQMKVIDFIYDMKDSKFPLEYTKRIKEVVLSYDMLPYLVEWSSGQGEHFLFKFFEIAKYPKVTIPEYADIYFSSSMNSDDSENRRAEVDFLVSSLTFVRKMDSLLKELNITVLLAPRKMITSSGRFQCSDFDGIIRLLDTGNYSMEYPTHMKETYHSMFRPIQM
uniref:NACHT domain-containing protein n=1 Tax=Clytia hemisphaerica TaxID=252671 RepID=A0A7M5V3K4_9CNID